VGPPAQVDLVTRAAGIAVPPNQGSSSSLLEAVAAPLVQEVPVMRGLDTARRADPSDSSGSDSPRGASDQALLSVGRLAGANGGGALSVGSALRSRDALTSVFGPHSSVTKQEKVLVYLLVYQVS
jgi:hypothetical protein